MSRLPFAALALAAFAGVAAAQPAARPAASPTAAFDAALGSLLGQPGGLTAEAAADRAARFSVTARRKLAEYEAARTDIDSVALALVPRTTLSAGYTRLSHVDPPQLAPGFSIPTFDNTYHLGAEVAVPLTELFLRVPPLRDAARHQLAATKAGEQAARLAAASDARVAYYEWVRAELQVVVAQRLLAQVSANLEQIRVLAEVQRVSRADVMRLEAQRAQAELAVAQVGQLVALRKEQLRIAMGADADEPLAIGEDVRQTGDAPALGEARALLDGALTRRVELQALDAASAAIADSRRAGKVDRLPQLNIFAQGTYDNPNQRIFPQEDDFKFTWAAGAQLSWSLNRFLEHKPADRKLAAQQKALEADRAGLALGIRGEITAAREAVLLADAAYKATQEGLKAAEEGYRVRQELLAAERATAIELVDAETELTRARVAAIDALIDRRIAWARLRHATGEDVR